MSNSAYNCTVCGKRHEYTPYVLAHHNEHLMHRCSCGAAHDLFQGQAHFIDPMRRRNDGARLTEWFAPDAPPAIHGYYHIRFPNGTEADRNWFWDGSVWRYDKGSPASISANCIGGWRGLDRYVAH